MTGAEAIAHHQHEHIDELERLAEIKLKQAMELQYEAIELQERANRLRMILSRDALEKGAGE